METWRKVIGFEDLYEVSDLGRIKSVAREFKRSDGRVHRLHEKILRQFINPKTNFMQVTLIKDGHARGRLVHRLVADAFISSKFRYRIEHIDGDRKNNALSNLRCVPND